jgi:hypothetical protein
LDWIIPSQREHRIKMQALEEREKEVANALIEAQVLETRAKAARERAYAKKLLAEAEANQQEAERQALENEALRRELLWDASTLALGFLEQQSVTVAEAEETAFVQQASPSVGTLAASDIEIEGIYEPGRDPL